MGTRPATSQTHVFFGHGGCSSPYRHDATRGWVQGQPLHTHNDSCAMAGHGDTAPWQGTSLWQGMVRQHMGQGIQHIFCDDIICLHTPNGDRPGTWNEARADTSTGMSPADISSGVHYMPGGSSHGGRRPFLCSTGPAHGHHSWGGLLLPQRWQWHPRYLGWAWSCSQSRGGGSGWLACCREGTGSLVSPTYITRVLSLPSFNWHCCFPPHHQGRTAIDHAPMETVPQ